MPAEVVDAAGGCVSDGGVVPVEIVGVHPVLESASAGQTRRQPRTQPV